MSQTMTFNERTCVKVEDIPPMLPSKKVLNEMSLACKKFWDKRGIKTENPFLCFKSKK